jgi:hypothetical protein
MIRYERNRMLADAASIKPTNTSLERARGSTASRACEIRRTRRYELLDEAKSAIRTCPLKSLGTERAALAKERKGQLNESRD